MWLQLILYRVNDTPNLLVTYFSLAQHFEWVGTEFLSVVDDGWVHHNFNIFWLLLELNSVNVKGWVDVIGESLDVEGSHSLGGPGAWDVENEELDKFAVRVVLELLRYSIWNLVDSPNLLKFETG